MKLQQFSIGSIKRVIFWVLLLSLSPHFVSAADLYSGQRDEYWKQKQKVFKKITEDRYVLSTVQEQKPQGGFKVLSVKGAGLVNAPLDFTFKELQKFEELKEASKYIRQTKYDRSKKRLYVLTKAFGFTAQMMLKIQIKDQQKNKELQWEIIAGVMKGMTGTFVFKAFSREKTLLVMFAQHKYKRLPIPRIFVTFALEVILKNMAGNLRALVEARYQKQ